MKRLLTIALLAAIPFTLAGCGGDKDKDKDHKDHSHKDDAHKDDAHKDHDHKDEAHKDHDHKDEGKAKDGGHHEGEPHALGTVKAGAYDIKVVQMGEIKKGEGVLEIKVGGLAKGAATVRAWAGSEDGKGAVKAKAEYIAREDMFDVHVETGATLPAGAKWWVEVVPTGGTAVTASFDIAK